jgi:hypothetical protein
MMERPWLMVIPDTFKIEPANAPPTSRRSVSIYFKTINTGRTLAWLTGTIGTAEKMLASSLPVIPNYPELDPTLTPKPPNETLVEFARKTFEPDEYVALCDGKLDMVIYGIMTYRSALQRAGWIRRTLERYGWSAPPNEHITRYCISLARSPMGTLALSFSGPPAYNRYT